MTLRSTKWLQVLRVAAAPALVVGLSALAGTAQAQFFGDRYYNNEGSYDRGYGSQRYQQPQQRDDFFFGDRFMRPAPPQRTRIKSSSMRRRRASRPASRERTSGAWTSSTGWRA